ncbi:MAG: hypothetical protein KBD27_03535 [Candidatus Moranbacteria bacterium]|nr:hypothetical protein [Candidatus Moranbacteria bacterium]
MHEYKAGIHREIDHAFSGHEREAIKSLVEQQFDSSSTNRRHILDGHEAEAIIKDVHGIYSKEHADKLRTILDRRLQ